MLLNDYQLFSVALIVFAIAVGAVAYWAFQINKEKLPYWEKLPRHVILGTIIGFIDLIWCIPHTKPLLNLQWHMYLIPAAFFFTWVAYQFLDYLFSRAIGGFLILMAHYFLHESFTFHTPWSPVLAFFCFVAGIAGIIFAGKPYLLRDFIRNCAQKPAWRYTTALGCACCAVFSLTVAIMQLAR